MSKEKNDERLLEGAVPGLTQGQNNAFFALARMVNLMIYKAWEITKWRCISKEKET